MRCSISLSVSLHSLVWRPLRGWTSEKRLLKKQVVWVLAHSLPVVLPEGLPWKQGVWQALGGSATAAGTSFLTAWWRHHRHTMHNNNNYWRKKMRSDSVNCCVAQMFISNLVKHPGIFPRRIQGTILQGDFLPIQILSIPGGNTLINYSLNRMRPLWNEACLCVFYLFIYIFFTSRWHERAVMRGGLNQQLL